MYILQPMSNFHLQYLKATSMLSILTPVQYKSVLQLSRSTCYQLVYLINLAHLNRSAGYLLEGTYNLCQIKQSPSTTPTIFRYYFF
jgi:hypothetical protein